MTLPPPLTVLPARLHDLEQGSRLEWLEVDGRGGYASSTAIGANTRRYHGLLVVARRPPTDRVVLLSRIEESLIVRGGERFDLSVNFYPGAVHPHGHRYLEEFKLDPWPIWRYRLGPYTLTKALFMARGVGATVLLYHLRGGDALLELRPLVAGRDFHALGRASAIAPLARARPGRVIHHANEDLPPLVLSFRGGDWDGSAEWYWQTVYPRETERGLDDREDLYCIGTLRVPLAHNRPWRLACGTRPLPVGRAADWAAAERRRRTNAAEGGRQAAGRSRGLRELGARLGLAADVFLVERDPPPRGGAPCGDPGSPPHEAPRGGGGRSIIAGYPWFADWGRDALIALPGL
ncbi:MAG: glycogen debranching enzyme family protein, partial [Gemmatimonadetes bacterium]|nr:glycogen debranching enzyme family protein [Gemmatimonadota bacterium]